MFQRNTTIVVGAGASNEYELPLGGGLTEIIARDVNIRFDDRGGGRPSGDEFIIQALRQAAVAEDGNQNINRFLPACREIVAGMSEAQSIDTFINSRAGDECIELVGKLGILRSILRAERQSYLWVDPRSIYNTIDFNKIRNTWLPKFRKFVCDGVSKEKAAERFKKITLIVFNYDRCIEHYLIHSLREYYGVKEKEAIEIFDALTIIHPYGVVGPLPWQGNGSGIAYGETEIRGRLLPLVSGIHTFTEQAEDEEQTESIRKAVENSNPLIFLGFAFHDQNIEVLVPEISTSNRHIYGTAVGISQPVQFVLRRRLAKDFCANNNEIVTLNSKCECWQLFDEYGGVFSVI